MRRLTLNQALILAAFVALLPIAVLSIVQGMRARDFARDLIGERLVAGALTTAAVQRDDLGVVQRMLAAFAVDPLVRGGGDRCIEAFKRGVALQRAAINFTRAGADGRIVCAALPLPVPNRPIAERWWREGAETRKLTFSPPRFGRMSRRTIIVAMHPLTAADGSFDGAVTAAIDVSWLQAALRGSKLSANGMATIVDRTGNILVSSRPDGLRRIDIQRTLRTAASMTAPDGSRWIYASAPLYEQDLFVVYAEPERPLLSPLRDQAQAAVILPILAILLTCLAIYAAMNRFVLRWLRALGRSAERFSRGDYRREDKLYVNAPAEIAELGEDLSEMAKAIDARDAELQRSAEANKAMAREVNHRVKNNLQMVMSLLGLQAARLSDHQARGALEQTRIRVGAVALVHRLLYDQGEASDRGEVDMRRLTEDLCAQLASNFRSETIALKHACAMGTLSVDKAIPITLFIVEAVTNAYRHGYSEGQAGLISVLLDDKAGQATICVSDDGRGQDGVSDASTLGMELMDAYASQLGGRLELVSKPGQGMSIAIVIPPDAVAAV